MTRQIIFAAAAILSAGTVAALQYNNASGPAIVFDPFMDCTTCIRAGYDYCLYADQSVNPLATKWGCFHDPVVPEFNISKGSTNAGYVCSGALSDQTNAIVNGCRQKDATVRNAACGDYLVDLTV